MQMVLYGLYSEKSKWGSSPLVHSTRAQVTKFYKVQPKEQGSHSNKILSAGQDKICSQPNKATKYNVNLAWVGSV